VNKITQISLLLRLPPQIRTSLHRKSDAKANKMKSEPYRNYRCSTGGDSSAKLANIARAPPDANFIHGKFSLIDDKLHNLMQISFILLWVSSKTNLNLKIDDARSDERCGSGVCSQQQ